MKRENYKNSRFYVDNTIYYGIEGGKNLYGKEEWVRIVKARYASFKNFISRGVINWKAKLNYEGKALKDAGILSMDNWLSGFADTERVVHVLRTKLDKLKNTKHKDLIVSLEKDIDEKGVEYGLVDGLDVRFQKVIKWAEEQKELSKEQVDELREELEAYLLTAVTKYHEASDEKKCRIYYLPTYELLMWIRDNWEQYEAMEPRDIFAMTGGDNNRQRQLGMFRYLGVKKMMETLEAKRILSNGIDVQYDDGTVKENVYEIYEADGEKLAEELTGEKIYSVKCWDTSTNKEYWIWIDEKYKDDPLAAIASTFWMHENVIEQAIGWKRQGDVIIPFFGDRDVVKGEGKERPLTKEEYFGKMLAEA